MKKILLILFFFCYGITNSIAQWVQIASVPTTQLNAVKFFDQNTGVTVGVGGIWRTTNGGYNWRQTYPLRLRLSFNK